MKRRPTKWFAKHSYWHWADIIWRRLHKLIFDIVLTLHHLFQFHEWNTLASYNEQSISSVYWTIYIVLHQPIVYPSANFSLNVKVTMVLEKMIVCAKKFCDWRKITPLWLILNLTQTSLKQAVRSYTFESVLSGQTQLSFTNIRLIYTKNNSRI